MAIIGMLYSALHTAMVGDSLLTDHRVRSFQGGIGIVQLSGQLSLINSTGTFYKARATRSGD
jgi:hypothetical protein